MNLSLSLAHGSTISFDSSVNTTVPNFANYQNSVSTAIISYEAYDQLSVIKSRFNFSSSGISETLIQNLDLSNFIQTVIDELGTYSVIWYGELKIVEDDYSEQRTMLLIYRPCINTSSSLMLSEESFLNYSKKNVYENLLGSLFHTQKNIKNFLVIDEQVI
jgi:hypothetical protein